MKLKCYETVTRTSCVEVEIDDDADDAMIVRVAANARHLHGCKIVDERTENWYVKEEDDDEIPKFGNPLNR